MTKIAIQERYRRADKGTYCTKDYAERHPSTTILETRKITKSKH